MEWDTRAQRATTLRERKGVRWTRRGAGKGASKQSTTRRSGGPTALRKTPTTRSHHNPPPTPSLTTTTNSHHIPLHVIHILSHPSSSFTTAYRPLPIHTESESSAPAPVSTIVVSPDRSPTDVSTQFCNGHTLTNKRCQDQSYVSFIRRFLSALLHRRLPFIFPSHFLPYSPPCTRPPPRLSPPDSLIGALIVLPRRVQVTQSR